MVDLPVFNVKETNGKEERDVSKNFNLEIKNFGPISSGSISIKPLTILIGPNQSGKSYASMLIYSIYRAQASISNDKSLMDSYYDLASQDERAQLIKIFDESFSTFSDQKISFNVAHDLVNKIFKLTYQKAYEKKLDEEITRSFASSLKELRCITKVKHQSFSFKIIDSNDDSNSQDIISVQYKDEKLQITQFPNYRIVLNVEFEKTKQKLETQIINLIKNELKGQYEKKEDLEKVESIKKRLEFLPIYFFLINSLQALISEKYAKCYYLPAARSGILQGHKVIFTSIIKLAPYAGNNRIEIPTLSGVISDFINSLVIMPKKKGPLYSLARRFEDEIIYGKITIDKMDQDAYPEIRYTFKNTEIPIHRASSTVSELAPIFLYLKYIVKPKDVLIIEEPEAHLHPINQRILARLIVNLIRNGVRIIITTHSDYLLEQINNYLLINKIDANKRIEQYNLRSDEFLKANEISANVFQYSEKKGNYIAQLKVTDADGIPLDEFLKVTKELYQESVKIQRDLNN